MAEEIVRRRRVVAEPTEREIARERPVDQDGSAGLGVALAVALAILAILALIAVGRGFFAPSSSNTGTTGTTPAPVVQPPAGTIR